MASSSIRQPDDVFVSVALPLAPGREVRSGASAAWKRWAERARARRPRPRSPTASDGGRRRAGQDEPARRCARAERAAAPRSRARSAAGASTSAAALSRERDRALLLGEPVGELGRGRDSRLERRATLGRERSVGERRQLGVGSRGVRPSVGVASSSQHER